MVVAYFFRRTIRSRSERSFQVGRRVEWKNSSQNETRGRRDDSSC